MRSLFTRGSRYAPIPIDDAPGEQRQPGALRGRVALTLKLTAVALLHLATLGYLAVALLCVFDLSPSALLTRSRQPAPRSCDTPERGFQCGKDTSHSWGQYSPYFSVPSEIDASVPEGCELTFAQILSRHGARAPTLGKALVYASVIARIQGAVADYGPGYEFLKTYEYALGANDLTRMGEQQMVNSGLKFYHRYRSLARASLPFVRASGQERVVRSALNWTRGFYDALLDDGTARDPGDMVIIPEIPTANNTLHHSLCRAFETGPYSSIGADAQAVFLAAFAMPITARLNSNLPGANLTDLDTVALMDLCPFNTVASPSGATLSPFCDLFTRSEWQSYDYLQSLGKWYGFGPGNPLGPTQGVGFVNELLARLTRSPVNDTTSSNATLDGDERTFPLDRAMYADFSHDNDMMGVLGALGVYEGVPDLDNTTRRAAEENGGYAASWAVPFAARVYVEKMRCLGEEEELVRVLVNDRVMGLKGCDPDELGRCRLGRFVESMAFARGGGRWDLCFV
ncbi:hypothetical protein MFIFM68171_06881 [Madurella fahalii]|uniref:Phytase A n=1 Tax=Madurella fahalii TaxID=1157608 RepID=A0ABQ0GFY0_9PEZI